MTEITENPALGPREDDDFIDVDYIGEGRSLFWLAIKTLGLTVITLGIYRFWMKARLRRYYWSSIRIDRQALEFTGSGLEMFLGFLLAVVFLAIYLAIFQLLLSFAGMAIFEHPLALNITFLALIPLIYYATYRARRYLLSRTRWRGIRFGMDKGAVDYMVRALGYALLAIITLGFMAPFADFQLRRFVVDRSYFGDLRFRQEGHWTGYLRPWLWVMGSVFIVLLGIAGLIIAEEPVFVIVVVIGYIAMMVALVHYSVASFRYSVDHTILGDGIRFDSTVRTGKVIGLYLVGGLLLIVATSIAGIVISIAFVVFGLLIGLDAETIGGFMDTGAVPGISEIVGIVSLAFTYIFLIMLTSAFAHVLITQPVLRTYVETVMIAGRQELESARQRSADELVEAEGFADALDVGAAI